MHSNLLKATTYPLLVLLVLSLPDALYGQPIQRDDGKVTESAFVEAAASAESLLDETSGNTVSDQVKIEATAVAPQGGETCEAEQDTDATEKENDSEDDEEYYDDDDEEYYDEEEEEVREGRKSWTVEEMRDSDNGILGDYWQTLDCDNVSDYSPPKDETWTMLRNAYTDLVGPQQSSLRSTTTGFQVPIYIDHIPEKGRAVFAQNDILKGTLVWRDDNTALFRSGRLYRRFLATVPPPAACDLIQWCYVQLVDKKEDSYAISCDFDEGTLLNSAEDGSEVNIEARKEGCEVGRECLVATRDIKKKEEILLSYGNFAYSNGWVWFGL